MQKHNAEGINQSRTIYALLHTMKIYKSFFVFEIYARVLRAPYKIKIYFILKHRI